jgi:dTDP-4-dehydrorhamnose 3,5-epimerase
MSRFTFSDLPLQGLKLIERQRLGDSRGYLSRLFCEQELSAAGWLLPIAQINNTFTARRGTVRGMHYQTPPKSEMKLVTCIKGVVWDVAIDLRFGSPTFLNWHAEILSEDNDRTLIIPAGFAHGFQTLSDKVNLLYCHSAPYTPNAEAALNAKDSRLAINWPEVITEMSNKDESHPLIEGNFEGVCL